MKEIKKNIISKCCKSEVTDESIEDSRSPWYVCKECMSSCEIYILPIKNKGE